MHVCMYIGRVRAGPVRCLRRWQQQQLRFLRHDPHSTAPNGPCTALRRSGVPCSTSGAGAARLAAHALIRVTPGGNLELVVLHATCYVLHATCYMLHAAGYMPHALIRVTPGGDMELVVLHATCYVLRSTCYAQHATCYMLQATCRTLSSASLLAVT